MTEHKDRNGEAKFASPDGCSVGIGYYIDGEEVSPEEFSRRVAEDAVKIKAERDDGEDAGAANA